MRTSSPSRYFLEDNISNDGSPTGTGRLHSVELRSTRLPEVWRRHDVPECHYRRPRIHDEYVAIFQTDDMNEGCSWSAGRTHYDAARTTPHTHPRGAIWPCCIEAESLGLVAIDGLSVLDKDRMLQCAVQCHEEELEWASAQDTDRHLREGLDPEAAQYMTSSAAPALLLDPTADRQQHPSQSLYQPPEPNTPDHKAGASTHAPAPTNVGGAELTAIGAWSDGSTEQFARHLVTDTSGIERRAIIHTMRRDDCVDRADVSKGSLAEDDWNAGT